MGDLSYRKEMWTSVWLMDGNKTGWEATGGPGCNLLRLKMGTLCTDPVAGDGRGREGKEKPGGVNLAAVSRP